MKRRMRRILLARQVKNLEVEQVACATQLTFCGSKVLSCMTFCDSVYCGRALSAISCCSHLELPLNSLIFAFGHARSRVPVVPMLNCAASV